MTLVLVMLEVLWLVISSPSLRRLWVDLQSSCFRAQLDVGRGRTEIVLAVVLGKVVVALWCVVAGFAVTLSAVCGLGTIFRLDLHWKPCLL